MLPAEILPPSSDSQKVDSSADEINLASKRSLKDGLPLTDFDDSNKHAADIQDGTFTLLK